MKCELDGCNNEAKYGYGYNSINRCFKHKINEMKHISLYCKCNSGLIPVYTNDINTKPEYCSKCKKDGMIDKYKKYCKCGLSKPIYGLPNTKAECCTKCKTDGMIDLIHKLCICGNRPSFAININEKPTHCSKCKENCMINVIKKTCKCGKVPTFGYNKTRIACINCKDDDMVDLGHKKCIKCNKKRAYYGTEEGVLHCKDCKDNDDKNISVKRCLCKKTTSPTFNYPDCTIGICCKSCKNDDMINVLSLKCICNKTATFGYVFDKYASCCYDCKKENMIRLRNNLCICGRVRASFGYINDSKPLYCNICKKDNMVSLTSVLCKGTKECREHNIGCPYNIRANPKYDNYCVNCFIRDNPYDIRSINARKNTYELIVRDYLITTFPEYNFIHDKPLWLDSCDCEHKRIIDFRCLINDTLLCIEVDEDQHKYRDVNDEENRYNDIFMIHSGKLVFIRFNPNKYKKDNKIIKDDNLIDRLNILRETIIDVIKNINNNIYNELLYIIKLFYDTDNKK